MADINIMTGNNAGEWTIVMHFPVPDTDNAVGVNFRTALLNSGLGLQENGRRTILASGTGPGQITTVEEAQLDSGAIYEHSASFRAESGGTGNAVLQASVREFYVAQNASVQLSIGSKLRYFGHTMSAS